MLKSENNFCSLKVILKIMLPVTKSTDKMYHLLLRSSLILSIKGAKGI